MAAPLRNPAIFTGPHLSARLQTDPAGVVEAPARPNPGIVIHVGRSVHIACTRAGRRHQGVSVHGDVDIVPSGVESRWELKDEDTALILGVPAGLLRRIAEESGRDPGRIEIANRFQIRDPQLEHIGWALKAEMEAGFPNGHLYTESLATAIAVHLLNRHSSQSPALPESNARMPGYRLKRVLGYIEDHLADDLSVAQLAAVAGLSVSHFGASFRACAGQSVHQYVTRRRVDRARTLLRQDGQTVGQVAMATGFAHGSHLAYHMRRLLGISPRDLAERR
jgi:AraC family transcriptional regulator